MSDDADDDRPFTPSERKALRQMMENEARVAWMWRSARIWAAYISAGIITGYAVYQAMVGWFQTVFRKVGGP